MAGFFSLGGASSSSRSASASASAAANTSTDQDQQQQHAVVHPPAEISPEHWFLYRNEDNINPPYKGFELWQYHHHHHLHQQRHHNPLQDLYPGIDVVGSTSRLNNNNNISEEPTSTTRSAAAAATFVMMRSSSSTGGGIGGGVSCQDCGNQAKKDCAHMRCRTCCKSRGFQCATHVKSTWVPAAKRRERQQQLANLQQQEQQQNQHLHLLHSRDTKRHRENPTSSSLVCTRLPSSTTSGTTTTTTICIYICMQAQKNTIFIKEFL